MCFIVCLLGVFSLLLLACIGVIHAYSHAVCVCCYLHSSSPVFIVACIRHPLHSSSPAFVMCCSVLEGMRELLLFIYRVVGFSITANLAIDFSVRGTSCYHRHSAPWSLPIQGRWSLPRRYQLHCHWWPFPPLHPLSLGPSSSSLGA